MWLDPLNTASTLYTSLFHLAHLDSYTSAILARLSTLMHSSSSSGDNQTNKRGSKALGTAEIKALLKQLTASVKKLASGPTNPPLPKWVKPADDSDSEDPDDTNGMKTSQTF